MNAETPETKDPVFGMTVDESTALQTGRDGTVFYFCSAGCQQKFVEAPAGTYPSGKSGCCCG